jgi:hypothetical protein
MSVLSIEDRQALDALRNAFADALERKRPPTILPTDRVDNSLEL